MELDVLIATSLSKSGFGPAHQILTEWPTDVALAALEYAKFSADYQETARLLNTPSK